VLDDEFSRCHGEQTASPQSSTAMTDDDGLVVWCEQESV
jgi:hypothetical protein